MLKNRVHACLSIRHAYRLKIGPWSYTIVVYSMAVLLRTRRMELQCPNQPQSLLVYSAYPIRRPFSGLAASSSCETPYPAWADPEHAPLCHHILFFTTSSSTVWNRAGPAPDIAQCHPVPPDVTRAVSDSESGGGKAPFPDGNWRNVAFMQPRQIRGVQPPHRPRCHRNSRGCTRCRCSCNRWHR